MKESKEPGVGTETDKRKISMQSVTCRTLPKADRSYRNQLLITSALRQQVMDKVGAVKENRRNQSCYRYQGSARGW